MSSPIYMVDRHDDGFSERPTSHLVQVSELSPAELREWAAVPLDGADARGVERIVWARCWMEPERARERCVDALEEADLTYQSALVMSGNIQRALSCVHPDGNDGNEIVSRHWLRALAALDGITLEARE